VKWQKYVIMLVIVIGVATAIGAGTGSLGISRADKLTGVGYVDSQRLAEEYVRPVLIEEKDKLQARFDQEKSGLTEEEQKNLLDEYQVELDKRIKELADERFQQIDGALKKVAQREGMNLVLDKQATLYGGVDITEAVLTELTGSPGEDGK